MDIFEELDLTDSSGAPPKPVISPDFDFMTEFLDDPEEDNAEISNLNLSCDDEPEWCDGCKKLKQDITGLQQEYKQNILTLKQKIVPTDLLIKRYNSKCQDILKKVSSLYQKVLLRSYQYGYKFQGNKYCLLCSPILCTMNFQLFLLDHFVQFDTQNKKLEDLTKKFEKSERACTTLEAQLQSAMSECQPVKDANRQLERDKQDLIRRCGMLGDQVEALKSTCQQFESMNRSSENFNNEAKNFEKKVKQAEDAKARAEQQAAKFREDFNNQKNELIRQKRLRRAREDRLTKVEKTLDEYSKLLKSHGLLPGAPTSKFYTARRTSAGIETVERVEAIVEDFSEDDVNDDMEGVAVEADVRDVVETKEEDDDGDCALLDKLLQDMSEAVRPDTGVTASTSSIPYDGDSDSDLSVGFTNLLNMQPALSPLPPSPVIELVSDSEVEEVKVPSLARKRQLRGRTKQPSPLARRHSNQLEKEIVKKSPKIRTKSEKSQSTLVERESVGMKINSGKKGDKIYNAVKFVSGGIQTLEGGKAIISSRLSDDEDKATQRISPSGENILRNDLSLSGSSSDEETHNYDCGDDSFFASAPPGGLDEKENAQNTENGSQFDFHELYKQLPRQSTRSFEVNQNLDETQLSPRRARIRSLPGGQISRSPAEVRRNVKGEGSKSPLRRRSIGSPIRRSPRLRSESSDDGGIKERLRSRSPLRRNDAFDERSRSPRGHLCRDDNFDTEAKGCKTLDSVKPVAPKDAIISRKTRKRTVSLNEPTVTRDKSPASGDKKVFTRSRSHLSVVFKDNMIECLGDGKLTRSSSSPDVSPIKTAPNQDGSANIESTIQQFVPSVQIDMLNTKGANSNSGAKAKTSEDDAELSESNIENSDEANVSIGRRSLRSHSTSSDVVELPKACSKSFQQRNNLVAKRLRSLGRKVQKGGKGGSKVCDGVSRDQGVLTAKRTLRGRSLTLKGDEVVSDQKLEEKAGESSDNDKGKAGNVNTQADDENQCADVVNMPADDVNKQSDIVNEQSNDVNRQADVVNQRADDVNRQADSGNEQPDNGNKHGKDTSEEEDHVNKQADVKTKQMEKYNEFAKCAKEEKNDETVIEKKKDDVADDSEKLSGKNADLKSGLRTRRERKSSEGSWEGRRKKRGSGGFTVSEVKFLDVAEDGEDGPTSPGFRGKRARLGKSYSEDWGRAERGALSLKTLDTPTRERNVTIRSSPKSPKGGSPLSLDLNTFEENACGMSSKRNARSVNPRLLCDTSDPNELDTDNRTDNEAGNSSLLSFPGVASHFETEKTPDFNMDINEIFKEIHSGTDLMNDVDNDSNDQGENQNATSGHFTLTVDSEIEEAFRGKGSESTELAVDPTCRRGSKRLKPSAKKSKKTSSHDSDVSKPSNKSKDSGDINDNIAPQNFTSPIYVPSNSGSVNESELPPFIRMSQSCVTVVSPETSGIPGGSGGGSVGRSETPLSISSIESTASSPVSPLPMSPITIPELITPISPLPPTPEPLRQRSPASDSSSPGLNVSLANFEQTPTPSIVSPLPETPYKPDSPVPSTSYFESPARFDASVPKDVLTVKPQSRRNLKTAFRDSGDLSDGETQDRNLPKNGNLPKNSDILKNSGLPKNKKAQKNSRAGANLVSADISQDDLPPGQQGEIEDASANLTTGESVKLLNKREKRAKRRAERAACIEESGLGPAAETSSKPTDAGTTKPASKTKTSRTANSVQAILLDKLMTARTPKAVETVGAEIVKANPAVDCLSLAEQLVRFMEKRESNLMNVLLLGAGKERERHCQPLLSDIEKRFIRLVLYLKDNLDSFWSPLLRALSSTILSDKPLKILARLGLCRIFTGLCRLSANADQLRVLIYDILMKRDLSHSMLLSAMSGVWRTVLVKERDWSNAAIGPVTMIDVIEYVVLKDCDLSKPCQILIKICGWRMERVQQTDARSLALKIISQLRSYSRKKTDRKEAVFELHKALELLAIRQGWPWTYDVFIKEIVFPAMEELSDKLEKASNNEQSTFNDFLVNLLHSLGEIYSCCPPAYTNRVVEIMNKLAELLQVDRSPAVPWHIQTNALETLLILSPFSLDMVATVTTKWTTYCSKNSLDIPTEVEQKIETFRSRFKERLPYLTAK
ncbi:uncharacterized protein LOC135494383 [Lineus longissimus]|uniref:uncharacterized protein LOC135494383 n=1 Tax=Lineus longissimus TaxID=88925 RepID=UPI00315DCB6A